MSLSGKVCVVSGASSGIGRRTSIDMASDGAIVCAAARRGKLLEALVDEMGGRHAGHSFFTCDVSRREDVHALADHVERVHGRCDVLVNNAGFSRGGPFDGPGALKALEDVLATNFFGAAYCTAELMALLERSAPSHVVNVASIAGRLALPGSGAYCASKFALVGWTEALHYELARRDIHMSLITPGAIPTDGFPHRDVPRAGAAVGRVEDVSAAIRGAIARRSYERVVPRTYRLLPVARALVPPLYRMAQARLAARLRPLV